MPDPQPALPAKPGWQTSEFWLKLIAAVMTALYAGGVFTNDRVIAVAAITSTFLGAMGYTVARTIAKRPVVANSNAPTTQVAGGDIVNPAPVPTPVVPEVGQ